jgi:Ubiquitin carboxyl-terminal hydrolase, family 1
MTDPFPRLIDMKYIDRRLREEVKAFTHKQKQAAKKAAATPKSQKPKKSKKEKAKAKKYILSAHEATLKADSDSETDLGFHFTAYIPAHNQLWRLDGLQRAPESLGSLSPTSNWLDMAVAELSAQWHSAAENEIEFSLLSLVAVTEDEAARAEENVKAERMKEDWGPALAELVRGVADSG